LIFARKTAADDIYVLKASSPPSQLAAFADALVGGRQGEVPNQS
jgi:hypothetical protein